MDFIAENYLWIILIVIVILMAIVGYIADKTGFIAKAERPNPRAKFKSSEKPVVIANRGIDELLEAPVEIEENEVEEVKEEEVVEKDSKKKSKTKKSKEPKKSKKSKKQEETSIEEVVPVITEDANSTTDDVIVPIESATSLYDTFENPVQIDLANEDLTAPLVSNVENTDTFTTDSISEDLMAPLVSDSVKEEDDTIDESLFAPLESTDSDITQELNPVEITSLQEIEGDAPVVNEQEDIWKF